MERKDYYKILGITEEEKKLPFNEFQKVLKKKHRKLVIQLHPDKNGDKSESEKKELEEKFKEVAEAYEILSNEQKKNEYDNPTQGFDFSNFGGFNGDPFDMFSDFFQDRGFGNRRQAPQRGQSIRLNVKLTLEEIYQGCHKKLKYNRLDVCSNCGGSGKTKDTVEEDCPHCGGTGMLLQVNGNVQMMQTCPHCHGKGKTLKNPCPNCNGSGLEVKSHEVEIDIPKGIPSNSQLTLKGHGSASPNGNQGGYGDLIVVLTEMPHDTFQRRDNDVACVCQVPIIDAILGCVQEVTTIDGGKLQVKVKQGTEDGTMLKVQGRGFPLFQNEGVRGDMYVIVKHKIPKNLTEEEKNTLLSLKNNVNFK